MVNIATKGYVKSSELKGGERVKFLNEGGWVKSAKFTYPDGTPKNSFEIRVSLNGEEKTLTLNKMSRDELGKAWGMDTVDWVNKTGVITLVDCAVAGQMKKIVVIKAEGNGKPKSEEPWDA